MKSLISTCLWIALLSFSFTSFAQLEDKVDEAAVLFQAIEDNDMEMLNKSLEKGMKPDARDSFEQTPLHRAATFGRTEAIEILLSAGANINAKDRRGLTPLFQAYKGNQVNAMTLLLENKADPLMTYEKDRNTLLHYVAKGGDKKLDQAELLLNHGANPKAQNLKKETPIDYAKKAPKHDMILKLLKDKRWKH